MTEIVSIAIAQNPVLAITDPEKFAEFLKEIRAEIETSKPDASTPKGRAEIIKLAAKVTRTKTAIDKAGKELNAEKRKQIDAVDAERRAIWDRLDALADEVRKPVTEWEKAEADREQAVLAAFRAIEAFASFPALSSADIFAERILHLEAFQIDPDVAQDDTAKLVLLKDSTLATLRAAHAAAVQREADQAELRRLREEKESRERADAERVARELAEKEEAERKERERREESERRQRQEQAEREAEEQRQRDIQEAAEQARQAEIRKANEERERIENAAREVAEQAELDRLAMIEANRREQEERERDAQARVDAANREAERVRREADEKEAARIAEENRIREEAERREKDRAHRGNVMKAAKTAIMEHGDIDEPTAKKIVLAIVAGEIPNVRLEF